MIQRLPILIVCIDDRQWTYLKDAEGPQQVAQLLCIELLNLGPLQDLLPEGCHHGLHLMQEGGIRPHDVGDVLQ